MPLTNNVIIKLNEITNLVENKNSLTEDEQEEIKQIFRDILERGDFYDVEEIESWLENEGSWKNKGTRTRITNISHYIQTRFDQESKLRIVSNEDDSRSCGN